MEPRKNVVVNVEDFSSITIMKPFSEGYINHLIVVHEDAYGEMRADLVEKTKLKEKWGLSDAEFEETLKL